MARLAAERVDCEARDLGESGIALAPRSSSMPFGEPIWLRFRLPKTTRHIDLKASLARCDVVGGHVTWALCFVEVPRVVRRMLRTYVHVGHGRVIEYDGETGHDGEAELKSAKSGRGSGHCDRGWTQVR